MKLSRQLVKNFIEGAIFASPMPLSIDDIAVLFADDEKLSRKELQILIKELQTEYALRALELVEVASGFRFQVRAQFSPWVSKLWHEKPPKLSRAMLETLAIIAYRQPVTRAEIEAIRGVVVSTQIIKALFDREWIVVVGHREVPGRPADRRRGGALAPSKTGRRDAHAPVPHRRAHGPEATHRVAGMGPRLPRLDRRGRLRR